MLRRKLLVSAGACAVALAATAAALVTSAPATGTPTPTAAAAPAALAAPAATTTVTVTVGKPSEFKYTLSKKVVPLGTVIFKVVNKGKIAHDFKIAGKKTPMLAAGKSATLRVVFKKKGNYAFLCTVTGHAAAGMKGLLGVGVAKAPTPPPPPPPSGGAQCTNPVSTTVQVDEWDYGFTFAPGATIKCGTVRFEMKNSGEVPHNFAINNVANARGAVIDPGQTTVMTVQLTTKGRFQVVCDVLHHIERGMVSTLTVE